MTGSALEAGHPNVVSHAEWLAARGEFLVKEKEFTRLRDELSRRRRTLPWEKVEKPYEFDSTRGKVTLRKSASSPGMWRAKIFIAIPAMRGDWIF